VRKPSESTLSRGVTVGRVLSSKTRIKLLVALFESRRRRVDLCVKELAETVGLSHSAISHQLARLADMGIVTPSRTGQTVCYSLTGSPATRALAHVMKQLTSTK